MRKKKIYIYYASIGSGHLVAARSIAQSLHNLDKTLIVETRDFFNNKNKNFFIQEISVLISNFLFPGLYSWIWKTGAFKWLYNLVTLIGPWQGSIMTKLRKEKPDLVICTHTLPCSIVARLKNDNPTMRLIAVPTDLFIHHFWPMKNVDAFIAPNDSTKDELMRRGFPECKIFTYGIPVSPEIKKYLQNKSTLKQQTNIVLAGGYRVAPYFSIHSRVEAIIEFLKSHRNDLIHWQFVFGNSKKMKEKADDILIKRDDIELFGFIDNVQKMIAQSDLVFTKPGGLTVAEAVSMNKPIILLSKGAGQERANSEYVVDSKLGILLDDDEKLCQYLKELYQNPNLQREVFHSSKINFLYSADNIAKLAKKML